MTSPAGLTYGTISFTVGSLLSAGAPLTGITGTVSVRPEVRGSLLAGSNPPVTLTTGPFEFTITDGVMHDAQGNTSISLVASDCPVLNPTGFTYKASYGVNGLNHGVIHFVLPGGSHVDLTTVGTIPSSTGDVRIVGPIGPQGVPGPANLVVAPTNPGLTQPGLWVQTGLPGGGYTIWIEDGA